MNSSAKIYDIEKYRQTTQPKTDEEVQFEAVLIYVQKYLALSKLDENEYNNIINNIRKNIKEIIESRKATTATQEEKTMDIWQEKYLDKLDRDIGEMKNSLRATEERIAQMVNQTLSEMRDRDNQRHQEYLSIKDDIASTRRWVIGIVVSIIIGVAGLVYANYQFLATLVQLLKP